MLLFKKIALCTCMFTFCFSLYAGDREVYNLIDNDVKPGQLEKGWNFYKEHNTSIENKAPLPMTKKHNDDPIALLKKILEENEKQTKIQEKIYSLLKQEIDPDPEIITLPNGEECVANSSEECYKMLITRDAKKIPVLVEYMKDPRNIEKAAKYAKWQARHLREAFDGGYSLEYSTLQYADSSYSLPVYGSGFSNTNGAGKILFEDKIKKDKLFTYKDKYKLKIYVGLNPDMDVLGFTRYMKFLKDSIPENNFQVIFLDKDSKELWSKIANKITDYKNFYFKKVFPRSVVSKNAFKEGMVYTSPTLSVVFKDVKTNKLIERIAAVGNGSSNGFETSVIKLLMIQKVIPSDKDAGYRHWLQYSDIAYDEMKNKYGIDIDKDFIERLKKKQREQKNIFDKKEGEQ